MTYNRKAFTLVEMLFVVIIAMLVLSFSAYKLKKAKFSGLEKGATGFLVDLANAKMAMKQDLALQGVNLDAKLAEFNSCTTGGAENIEVTSGIIPDGTSSELKAATTGKALNEFLQQNEYGPQALLVALVNYGYIRNDIPAIGAYRYYINIGCDIPDTCGMVSGPDTGTVVAYMCRKEVSAEDSDEAFGWAFMSNGALRKML